MIKINNHLEVLKKLNRFSQSVARITTIEELASGVSKVMDDLFKIESSGLYLYDFQEKKLKLLIAKSFTDEERTEAEHTAMDRHPGYVFKTGKILNIPDTENDPERLTSSSARSFEVRSRLFVPVLNGTQPVGAFGIVSSQKNSFTEVHEIILSFICNIAGGTYSRILSNAVQRQAHEHLAAITVRLETLIKNLQSGILVEDQDRNIALINKQFCDMFMIPVEPDLLLGSDCSNSAQQSKGMFLDPDRFVSRIDEILRDKKPVTGEEIELASGLIFERDYIPIFMEGKFLGNLWQYRDITARVSIEKELRKAMADAQSANLAKSSFLANMSHEIRTPLNAVIGLSRLMRDTQLNAEQQILNDKLLMSGGNLLSLINEILDFSKIEAGKVDLENIPFDIKSVLDKVYSFLSHAAEEKTIDITASMDFPFKKAVLGDPGRLQQVLTNLVNNAIKFTSDGSVDLSCSLLKKSSKKASFLFSVSDTGIGIGNENLKTIFEKFKQEDESVTRVYGGTGLGLAISRQLVGLMGGELEVESEKGKGSRFFFSLEFDTTDAAFLRDAHRKIAIDPEVLRGKSILVVEDNKINQFIVRSILEKWNILVDIASNGGEAIEILKQKSYNLILMDMQMPVMDGCRATRVIRNVLQITTPVIALTAYATKDAIAQAMDSGMDGYMTKPFEEETLFSQLLSTFGIPPQYISNAEPVSNVVPSRVVFQKLQYDMTTLIKLLGEDQAAIIDTIEHFVELTPEYAVGLYLAYEQHDMEELAKAAHKIKSSMEILASAPLRSKIKLIYEFARNKENLDKLPELIGYLKDNIPVLLLQLEEKSSELKKEFSKTI
jgi:signal transduction histidine kinase/ActR/RegA family two-component response regulator/putative methionine-R-sulfoxide reductase with GAF domain